MEKNNFAQQAVLMETNLTTDVDTNLPSKIQFSKLLLEHSDIDFGLPERWSKPKYKCELCGGGMCQDSSGVVIGTIPPKFVYRCNRCGHIDYME